MQPMRVPQLRRELPSLAPVRPTVFYTYFYNHARRLRLEKTIIDGASRSSNGYFKPLLDPGGRFRNETTVTSHETVSEVKRLQIYSGYM
jgi:hypothetical protein